MIYHIKARSILLFFCFVGTYIIIAINLYIIQIKNYDFYNKLAEQQYHITVTQTPPRGLIIDRSGKNYLAMNKDYIAAFLLPDRLQNKKQTVKFLEKYFPGAVSRLENNQHKHFMFVKRRLSSEEVEIINNEKPEDVFLLSEPGRYYPLNSLIPTIGLTNIDNKGLSGLELLYDHILAGKPTTFNLEKDARSGYYYFTKETSIQGDKGQPIQLTIDVDLQFLVQDIVEHTVHQFNAQEVAVIIMNPQNGEIITMLSYPYADPYNKTIHLDQLRNRILTDSYELGSVMKVFAALAALEEKVVTSDELIDCKNSLTTFIDGRRINTVKAHGIIPFTDVIAFSNNIGIAIVAKRLGSRLYDYYKKLGFGSKTGIFFPGESAGFLNPPEKWSQQSIISLSYGYEVSMSLLQLACAFCAIATGYKIKPILIKNNTANSAIIHDTSQLFSDDSLNTIKEILERTTQYGTARRAKIKGYRVMSKTGTANMLIDGKYNPEKNIYTCAGIVEKDNYRRVIAVLVKEIDQKNMYASTVAVPFFEAVAERMLIHDTIIS